jgi:tetratricopeptide (TPR) repeat protein
MVASPATAETIRLKNGRKILADSVREVNGKVEYTVGENTYAIPKSSVVSIDTGGSPVVTSHEEVPAIAPTTSVVSNIDPAIVERVIRNGKVDTAELAAIEAEGKVENSAVAYFFAAQNERERGSLEKALLYMDRAAGLLPGNDKLMSHQASLLLQMGRLTEAANKARSAMRIAPNVGIHHALLGFAYFQQSKTREAIKELKRSQELEPDPQVATFLETAERELKAESEFGQEASAHFNLRYEGKQAPATLRRGILDSLEQSFNDLSRDLQFQPRESIVVILYTNQQFFDVTRAPSWSGALNDGKLRIPVSGLASVDSELQRVLRHELTHSFINLGTRGRAPTWLHEGVAQIMEGQSSSSVAPILAQLYAKQANLPLNMLEGSFANFNGQQAQLAYAESLMAADYIRETYGISDIARIIKRLSEGSGTEAALRSTIHSGYGQLEQEIAAYLKKTYPN